MVFMPGTEARISVFPSQGMKIQRSTYYLVGLVVSLCVLVQVLLFIRDSSVYFLLSAVIDLNPNPTLSMPSLTFQVSMKGLQELHKANH